MSRDTINVEELRDWLDKGLPVTVLDVRPADQRAEWSIPGSVHVDAYEALKANDPQAVAEADLPPDKPLVTVCAAGRTSLLAARRLQARGFEALSLAGGMKAWSLAWNSAEVALPASDARVVQVRRTGKGCLSYIIGSQGQAAVVDAALDPQVYVGIADRHGWRITHVLDTHVHADHLSRSRSLAQMTGATLYLPAQQPVSYTFTPLHDRDSLSIGQSTLRVVLTPGHTPASACYLLDGLALFTGDTLFLTSVGRPDLEAAPGEAGARASSLYRSLHSLFALPSSTLVFPGHIGEPVPFDGRPIAAPLSEVRGQMSVLDLSEEAFVETILARIPLTPPNHHYIVRLNEAGLFPEGDPTDLEAGANRCAIS